MAAAAVQVAPHENDMIVEMRGFAQRMVVAVGRTGSGQSLSEVLAFQQAWNRNLPIIRSLMQKLGLPTRAAAALVEDGMYGPKTSEALCGIICGPGLSAKPPTKASGMPVWYTRNKDVIDNLTPPAPPPLDTVLDQSPPLPIDDTSAAQEVLTGSGSVIRDVIPVSIPSGSPPAPPVVISRTTSTIPGGVVGPVAEVLDADVDYGNPPPMTDEEMLALEVDTGFDEDQGSTILTARPKSRVPWLAAGLGAVGLGGLMFWWTQRKKRR